MKKFQDLVDVIHSAQVDAEKFEKGNSAAGTRLRAKMQEVKNLAQDIRKDVSEVKNMK